MFSEAINNPAPKENKMQTQQQQARDGDGLFDEIKNHPSFPKFIEFHLRNPGVYEALRDAALERKRRGFATGAIKQLIEYVRWDRDLKLGPTSEPWLINNSFAPFYARTLELCEPSLAGFFEYRVTGSRK